MKKDVKITVVGTQSAGGNTDTVEITTMGTYEKTADGLRLVYSEMLDEKTTVNTVFTVKGQLVNINRKGDYATNMMIQNGKRHHCHYRTPYGDLLMGTYGEELTVEAGRIRLEYTLDPNASLLSRNSVEISYILE